MPLTYHEHGRYRKLPVVRALLATNLLFAIAILVAWQWALLYVLGPITWAADQPVPHDRDFIHIFEYPLIVFWAGPAMAMAFGWVMIQGKHHKAALGILVLPLLILTIMLTLYWTVPNAGH